MTALRTRQRGVNQHRVLPLSGCTLHQFAENRLYEKMGDGVAPFHGGAHGSDAVSMKAQSKSFLTKRIDCKRSAFIFISIASLLLTCIMPFVFSPINITGVGFTDH